MKSGMKTRVGIGTDREARAEALQVPLQEGELVVREYRNRSLFLFLLFFILLHFSPEAIQYLHNSEGQQEPKF